MKRTLCIFTILILTAGLLFGCVEAKPFPGLEVSQAEDASEALTEVTAEPSAQTETQLEASDSAQDADFSVPEIAPNALEEQLRLIHDHADLWQYAPSPSEICSYCVTDLDHNGRLEILMSSLNTGDYSSITKCFEVNEAGDGLSSCIPTGLSADLQSTELVTCYTDGKSYVYAVSDTAQLSWQEIRLAKLALKLENSVLSEKLLASATNTSTISSSDIQSVCTDANGKAITGAAFEAIYDTQFSGWKKAEFRFGWIGGNYSVPGLEMLRTSYEIFAG